MKTCYVCKDEKPLEAFAIDKSRSDGLCGRCRACRRVHYMKDPERVADQVRLHRGRNLEKVTAREQKYYQDNKNKYRVRAAEYYQANKDRYFVNSRLFRAANPGYVAKRQAHRRAAERKATPVWANLIKIEEIYATSAWLTAESGEKWHVDHIVPIRGKTVCGLHCEANLALLPAFENISKSNRYWPDMWDFE